MALKGHALPSGGTIGVPAPASPYHNRSEILRGVEWWEEQGYRVKLASGIFERDAYVAGDERGRAADLMALFADPEVDAIQCFQGGFGSAQTIPHLDFDVVRANPKPFVGYSDITSLHIALQGRTGLVTFYGPGLASMDSAERKTKSRDFLSEHLLRALTFTKPLGRVPDDPDDPYVRTIRGGRVEGEMVGGDLWLIDQTIGTPWQIDLAGKILFFEEVGSPPWYIDGHLGHLRHAGLLDEVAGVVVGHLEKCDWSEQMPEWPQTLSIEDVLERHLEPLDVPAIYGLPMGHGKYLATTPLGVRVDLDADARTLTVLESALAE
jgi:muramoyltetrapeptide carboxypeptidase